MAIPSSPFHPTVARSNLPRLLTVGRHDPHDLLRLEEHYDSHRLSLESVAPCAPLLPNLKHLTGTKDVFAIEQIQRAFTKSLNSMREGFERALLKNAAGQILGLAWR